LREQRSKETLEHCRERTPIYDFGCGRDRKEGACDLEEEVVVVTLAMKPELLDEKMVDGMVDLEVYNTRKFRYARERERGVRDRIHRASHQGQNGVANRKMLHMCCSMFMRLQSIVT
jgi:hypothetical protein